MNLALSAGEMVALRGANGAGKTTLLQCLAGALRPSLGEVRWFGAPLPSREKIGLLGHESGLYPTLTARENLLFAGRMYGLDCPGERADHWLAAAGLERIKDQETGRLSRGQRQRLAIARAILHEPAILLLDEPFTSLDVEGTRWLHALLRQLCNGGCAIVIATHDAEDAPFARRFDLDGGRR